MSKLIMFEIGGLGFIRSIRPSPRKLRSDASILVFDGYKDVLWFWIGSALQLKTRRTATARVEKISQKGHRIGGEIIGGKGTQLITIEQDLLEENPQVATQFSQLIALLESPMEVRTETDASGSLIYAVIGGSTEQASKTIADSPTDSTAPPETQPDATPPIEVESKTRFGLEAALVAILRVHKDVHIVYSTDGQSEALTIESSDGLRHTLKRKSGKLSFKWDQKTPKELKQAVKEELTRLAS